MSKKQEKTKLESSEIIGIPEGLFKDLVSVLKRFPFEDTEGFLLQFLQSQKKEQGTIGIEIAVLDKTYNFLAVKMSYKDISGALKALERIFAEYLQQSKQG